MQCRLLASSDAIQEVSGTRRVPPAILTPSADGTPFAAGTRRVPGTFGVVRLALGLLLLAAAALKGQQLAAEPVGGTGLLDSRLVLVAAVECELLFGLWLLSGLLPRATWMAACGCFGLFACVSLYKGLSGAASCGCFGRVAVNPWYTFALDTAAVLALLRFPPPRPLPSSFILPPSSFAVLALFLLLGLPAGWAMATYRAASLDDAGELLGDGRVVVLEPVKWIGKRFPLLPYIDIGDQLAEGEWIVVLYRHGCPDCHRLLSELRNSVAIRPDRTPSAVIATVALPPHAVAGACQESPAGRAIMSGRVAESRGWLLTTPAIVHVSNGRAVAWRVGDNADLHGLLETWSNACVLKEE